MSDIPAETVDKMMVKCGRRCCICRRFRPTKLQVHHIIERSQGGTNDEENLIVTCFSCHTDVHTQVPFARRFSVNEQKGHRDAVVKMVAEGGLPSADTDDTDDVIAQVVREMRAVASRSIDLLPEAVEVLTKAVATEGPMQGMVSCKKFQTALILNVGGRSLPFDKQDRRLQATYERALEQLVQCRLLAGNSGNLLDVTYEGYLAADEFLSTRPGLLRCGSKQ